VSKYWSPRDYLLGSGWFLDEVREEGSNEYPSIAPWRDEQVYQDWHDFKEALLTQVDRDIERLGGYEAFRKLVEEKGIPLEQLEF
jgi:hypothetical protein